LPGAGAMLGVFLWGNLEEGAPVPESVTFRQRIS